MFNIRTIKNKIQSISNTQKITKTMEMVSASKMKKNQVYMFSGTPYLKLIKKIVNNTISIKRFSKSIFFKKKNTKKVYFVILSSDKGLCGSLNTNLFKKILINIKKHIKKKILVELIIFGKKAINFFGKIKKIKILKKIYNIGDFPSFYQIKKNIKVILKHYKLGKINKILIAYNKFINNISSKPLIKQLLPLIKKENCEKKIFDYLYEPNSKYLFNKIICKYINFYIFQCVLENISSEQSSRMLAMKIANDNSINYIKKLQLSYNKVRQSIITQEINEIISGSSAN
ncbi:ATP synthase F1 subunit gamma [Buchnera aphidicola (Taiwanaphis decaspermi)]|uniref:ATP synthase F1 subunit gamma n=1 Tax=Buchnera aphidicola TaxID=9 RepID=UPI0031B8AA89